MSEVLGLKNINMLTKEQYGGIEDVASDELYAISGSGVGFPSNRYEDLTLGAAGTFYTAPANGYFDLRKGASSGQYIKLNGWLESAVNSSGQIISAFLPVRKGDRIEVFYTATGTTHIFRFVYAEGE